MRLKMIIGMQFTLTYRFCFADILRYFYELASIE